jgi:hypothetical protein
MNGPASYFFILHPLDSKGRYKVKPTFFAGKGTPSIDQKLHSLQMRGDIINLATVAASKGKVETFWETVSAIRHGMPSIKDSWVTADFKSPERHVIGEPFCFEYSYVGSESRLPDAYKMDWIGLYKITDLQQFNTAKDLSQRLGCSMVMAKFRPPHHLNAQVQLRHFIWEPGFYQLHMNVVNSEKVIGSSSLIRVAFASAHLSCPNPISKSAQTFELSYLLDYQSLLHPTNDWIGIFCKNPPSYSAQTAIQRLMVPPKNLGVIHVDPAELETECEICYFQDFGTYERMLGRTSVRCVSRAKVASIAPVASTKGNPSATGPNERVATRKRAPVHNSRHMRFYVSGTFKDMQEERSLIHDQVMGKLRHLCDSRHISISFVDMRYGLDDDRLTDRVVPDAESCRAGTVCSLFPMLDRSNVR